MFTLYILYPLSKFLPALSQFLNHKKPDLVKQHTSLRLFTGLNKNPDLSIYLSARKWQITVEMAETAVLKEKYCLGNPISRALNGEKRI
jgi:hypothetical protein